jgi:Rieske Fe-S protein
VCPHLGCLLADWDASGKRFKCPCHDATFDPLKEGQNVSGPKVRELPYIPINAVDGKLVVAAKPTGYIGVKRG